MLPIKDVSKEKNLLLKIKLTFFFSPTFCIFKMLKNDLFDPKSNFFNFFFSKFYSIPGPEEYYNQI